MGRRSVGGFCVRQKEIPCLYRTMDFSKPFVGGRGKGGANENQFPALLTSAAAEETFGVTIGSD